jgi:hypothetical protein
LDDICDGNNSPIKHTIDKELALWMNQDKKSYALIVISINEEVSHHIRYIKDSQGVWKKLKDFYDSHL